jgi:hypothetical protein
MTRKEYIDALSRGLEGFDDESKRDISLEIEDHIDELVLKHPELSEEAIVDGLEKPETFAASLRDEAGIPDPECEKRGRTDPRAEKDRGAGRTRITIDGEALGDVIRRAFDVARLFKESKIFSEDRDNQSGDDDEPGRTLRFKDIPIGSVREISCTTKSSDIKIFLSVSGFSMRADGDEVPSLSVKSFDGKKLDIAANPGPREPASLELGVPSTVDSLLIRTISGDILVLDRIGDLELETASGDVAIKACSGKVRVRTASGDISLEHCSEELLVHTASGSVEMELDDQCCGAAVSTASGDIHCVYPEDFDANIRCSTVSGDVEYDGENVGAGTIRIGAALIPVDISTASGDISIDRS